jgi:hypothetical protein
MKLLITYFQTSTVSTPLSPRFGTSVIIRESRSSPVRREILGKEQNYRYQ